MHRMIFVTGASGGIGHGIADGFLTAGYKVAAGYCRNRGELNDLCEKSDDVFPVQVDVADKKNIRSALAEIRENFGSEVGILINNAAIAQEKPFLEISDSDWEKMLSVNLQGPFRLIQEVLPPMLEHGWGRIINISSIGGQWGGLNQVHYAAAKAGLINLSQSVAKLFSRQGVTCNTVSPGLIATDMAANELKSEAGREKVRGIPAGRIGSVEDVAGAVLYLASDDASYITGQTINVNGGMYFG